MFTDLQTRTVLRRTALAALLLLTGAPVALADPPGYDFMVFEQSLPATVSASAAPAAPQAHNAAQAPATAQVQQQTSEATGSGR